MISRKTAWKKAGSLAHQSLGVKYNGSKRTLIGGTTHERPGSSREDPPTVKAKTRSELKTRLTTMAEAQKARRSLDRDFFVSVLEATVTKRDAKTYLNTFNPARKSQLAVKPAENDPGSTKVALTVGQTPSQNYNQTIQLTSALTTTEESLFAESMPHIALVKLKEPDNIDDTTLAGVAKTLSQLRTLGMFSIVVVDCAEDGPGWKQVALREATRLACAIDEFGRPGSRVIDSAIAMLTHGKENSSPLISSDVCVDNEEQILAPLRLGELPVLPPMAYTTDTYACRRISSNEVLLALIKSFYGLQVSDNDEHHIQTGNTCLPKTGIVDRVIILDRLGGVPASHRPNGVHVFLNLEDEYESVKKSLEQGQLEPHQTFKTYGEKPLVEASKRHIENLELARRSLSMLPPTASAVITSPADAANLGRTPNNTEEITGLVGTRRRRNPLIHNLLTDKPVYSSSLPLGRIKGGRIVRTANLPQPPLTTFAKRGMPLRVYPDPKITPWSPPAPDAPRMKLTDAFIDLPRLVHLIDDSFNRKLDVQHYLSRVNEMLAGIIIAGAYEGGAILTWEVPQGLTYEEAFATGRMVPYLDKFAVLKRSQGSGGVADIVFNSMVRNCFPDGVCWRSRKDNPVNKWYSERSKGTYKMPGINWTMFWTVPGIAMDEQKFWDYESVCRFIEPSWIDRKAPAD